MKIDRMSRSTQPLGHVQATPGGEAVPAVQVSLDVDPLVGVTIGEFRVDGYLAHGGMGRVYTATHRRLPNLRRAVKVLADTTKESDHAAFMKEAQAASEVKSLNIVALHDFGFMPEGAPYLMMELLEGQTLEAHLKELGSIPYMEALALTQQVLAALGAIHSSGLVHRDIKPANLFLVNDASQGVVVKVMDLGLAAGRPKVHQDTGVGTEKEENRAGTPVYASPEQFGDLVVGPASDVYSLGVVLYELVTGSVPFPERVGDSESALPRRHIREKPKHPGVFVPDLPEPVASFMLSMLEKEPLKRPTVAAAQNQVKRLRERFRDRLREGPTQIKANPLEPPARNTDQLPLRSSTEEALVRMRRDRRPMLVVATVGVLVLLGLGIAVRMQPDERVEGEAGALAGGAPPEVAAAPSPSPSAAPVVQPTQEALAKLAAEGASAPPSPSPSAPPSAEEELAPLSPPLPALEPPRSPRPPAAATATRATKPVATASARADCKFDEQLAQYAQEERSNLLRASNASNASVPSFKAAADALDTAMLEKNCRGVHQAIERLQRAAGVLPGE